MPEPMSMLVALALTLVAVGGRQRILADGLACRGGEGGT